MSSQIFKNRLPDDFLFCLLEQICIKTDKYYLFNHNSFKKGMYNGNIPEFLTLCLPYYHISKRKYLDKKQTCCSFLTVLRQICNNNNIIFKNKMKYDKNSYDILYYIYFDAVNQPEKEEEKEKEKELISHLT